MSGRTTGVLLHITGVLTVQPTQIGCKLAEIRGADLGGVCVDEGPAVDEHNWVRVKNSNRVDRVGFSVARRKPIRESHVAEASVGDGVVQRSKCAGTILNVMDRFEDLDILLAHAVMQ
ncbi:MAG: hypothetical protein ACK559_18815, partial [bacterium]